MVALLGAAGYGNHGSYASCRSAAVRLDLAGRSPNYRSAGSIAAALDEIESLDDRVLAPFRTPGPNQDVVVPRLCVFRRLVAEITRSCSCSMIFLRNPESLRPLGSRERSRGIKAGARPRATSRDFVRPPSRPASVAGVARGGPCHDAWPQEGSALLECGAGLDDPLSEPSSGPRVGRLNLAALALSGAA